MYISIYRHDTYGPFTLRVREITCNNSAVLCTYVCVYTARDIIKFSYYVICIIYALMLLEVHLHVSYAHVSNKRIHESIYSLYIPYK